MKGEIIMKTKKICYFALGIALWVVFAAILKMTLIGHIQTDLAYIVFGVYCVFFGWQAAIVGFVGCMLESIIFSGWFPLGWMLGNAFIGFTVGYILKKYNVNKIAAIFVVAISVFLGIGIIKTVVEWAMYRMPFSVKFAKDMVATVVDLIPMYFGVILGQILKGKYSINVDI